MRLLDRRLLVVTGKGGVGRSTVATALGLAAARAGRSTAVVELHGLGSVPALWGLSGRSYTPRGLEPGLDTFSLTALDCLDDFGSRRLKVEALVRLVFHNRIMSSFLDAVPGLHDLLQLGKIENLLMEPGPDDPRYDLVVLDAPATGHGLTLLAAARSMGEMTQVGPFFDIARLIELLLADRDRTALVLVTLPEELPVNESLELLERLEAERDLVGGVVVNQVLSERLPVDPPYAEVRPRIERLPGLVALADHHVARQAAEDAALARLDAELPDAMPVSRLPRRPVPLRRDDLRQLASRLAEDLPL